MIAFRDADQRQRACRTLLSAAGLAALWTSAGPTDDARALVADGAHTLAPGARLVLLGVWGLWTGEWPPLRLDELVGQPEGEPLWHLLIASLYGPGAVDAWLSRPEPDGYVSGGAGARAAAARLFDEARAVLAENSAEAVNLNAAPDACALGVRQMADYAMIMGVDIVEDDEQRHQLAVQLAVRALGMFAALCAAQATSPPTG
ncbi:MAG TPA: hypothetical protein VIJ33_05220 [Solirubrobacteraceae bacterium]